MQEAKIGNDNALKYKNVEDLQKGIDEYFAKCDKEEKPYTMSGLACSLDIDRRTLTNYSHKDSFFPLIKRAKQRVEQQLEENALIGKGNATFTIFNLKNNYGWRDSVDINRNDEISKLDELLEEIKKDANN